MVRTAILRRPGLAGVDDPGADFGLAGAATSNAPECRRRALTQDRRPGLPFGGSAGFTLLEIMLVLAIMGLIAAVLIGGADELMNNRPVSPSEVFWKAVQYARRTAVKSNAEIGFKFVDDTNDKVKEFEVTGPDGAKDFPVPKPGDLEVSFLMPQSGGQGVIIAGTAVETQTVPSVTFYPDGTCSAFRVQFFRGGAAHIVGIDPWTCAPVLVQPDDNNGPAPQT